MAKDFLFNYFVKLALIDISLFHLTTANFNDAESMGYLLVVGLVVHLVFHHHTPGNYWPVLE